jgi:hypothetical protein
MVHLLAYSLDFFVSCRALSHGFTSVIQVTHLVLDIVG